MPTQDGSVARYVVDLPDPRVDRTTKHALGDIRVIALAATVAGADSWDEVERFGEAKADGLRGLLGRPNGIPSRDPFRRVFARLAPQAFARCVAGGTAGVREATGLRHIAGDGKSARSAPRGTSTGCLHLVGARAAENRRALGPRAVADGSNEIAAIPERLRVLALKGALVTIAAAGCQTAIARPVRDPGGDYLLAVTGNPPGLRDAVRAMFDRACEVDFAGVTHDGAAAVGDGHGRHEERYTTVVSDPPGLPPEWPDVAAVVLVGREREVTGERTDTAHYSVTSLRGTAVELGDLIRRHWAIENELHRVRDVGFRGDANKTAAGHAGAN